MPTEMSDRKFYGILAVLAVILIITSAYLISIAGWSFGTQPKITPEGVNDITLNSTVNATVKATATAKPTVTPTAVPTYVPTPTATPMPPAPTPPQPTPTPTAYQVTVTGGDIRALSHTWNATVYKNGVPLTEYQLTGQVVWTVNGQPAHGYVGHGSLTIQIDNSELHSAPFHTGVNTIGAEYLGANGYATVTI